MRPGANRNWIGGWDFPGGRKSFYPEDFAHAKELAFARRYLTTIEINSTFSHLAIRSGQRRFARSFIGDTEGKASTAIGVAIDLVVTEKARLFAAAAG